MNLKLISLLFYTYCLLHCPANLSKVDEQLSEETPTQNVDGEDSWLNLRVGRGSSTIDKVRMVRSNANRSTNTLITKRKFFEAEDKSYNSTVDNNVFDFIFEVKSRETAYKKTAANKSPHSILMLIDDVFLCTGCLLTRTLVLTAAHCLIVYKHNATNVTLYAGGNSLEEIKKERHAKGSQIQVSTEFYIHPDYEVHSGNDVAVVKAPREFNLTKTVNIIKISDRPWRVKGYKKCSFTGFGWVTANQEHVDDKTRKTHQLKIKTPCQCASVFDLALNPGTYLCSKPMENYGICTGDSGGGLICDGKISGIALHAAELEDVKTCKINKPINLTCGSKNSISIFQDSFSVKDWIQSHVNSHGCNIKLATGLLIWPMIINMF